MESASAERPPTSTPWNTVFQGTFISPRTLRMASMTPRTGPKLRSAASSTGRRSG